jgi:acetyl esterase/lipase
MVTPDQNKHTALDIPYADRSQAQKLDIYLPAMGQAPYPVIVYIHGGAFRFGDKASGSNLPVLEGLKRGYAVVSINYRLSAEALFPAAIHDIKAAIRWIRASAGHYGFDPKRIASWGDSAGGYLSLFAGVSAGVRELEDLSLGNPDQQSNVQAVVAWYPVTDFLKMDEQVSAYGLAPGNGLHSDAQSPESLLLGAPIATVPDLVKAANPETYITPAAPPTLLQHGTNDDLVPAMQSIKFAELLEMAIGRDKVLLDLLEGARHADPLFNTPANVKRVLDFLGRFV